MTQPSTHSKAPSEGFPTVGVLGGGQLGRMLALAAARLGIKTKIYDPSTAGPAYGVAERFGGKWDDEECLRSFIEGCDVITVENEWVELDTHERLRPSSIPLWPSRQSLSWITDKGIQKQHTKSKGLPVGAFSECKNAEEAVAAANEYGFPVVAKRPTHSYDGFGNATAKNPEELREIYQRLNADGRLLVEAWVPFVRELSVIVVRREDGESVTYPVAYTKQQDHRCEAVEVPAPIPSQVAEKATQLGRQTAEAFNIVGLLAVEIFELESGELLVNEVAPRPHNSGHFTIEGCVTSQFENHLRAVLGWPLGDTSLIRPAAVMVNILGERAGTPSAQGIRNALNVPRAFVHIYGKREVRPNRKMGHVTAIGDDLDEARKLAYDAANQVSL